MDEQRMIMIAPDKYKGCLSSPQVCAALERGIRTQAPDSWEVQSHPQADGGEGTVEAVVEAMNGEYRTERVSGPRGQTVEARWGRLSGGAGSAGAVIEMAAASGIALLEPEQQDPLQTTTRGTGELIRAAAEAGARELILGIGGSATVDGGMGMARALGYEFRDPQGRPVEQEGGGQLRRIRTIRTENVPAWVDELNVRVASDVTNPLLGPDGAARVFGPQKGADARDVEQLEDNLANWANVVEDWAGCRLRDEPGTGAAGGLGFGLMAFLDAELTSGARLIMEVTGLISRLEDADVVITGEGKMDSQTAFGKTPYVVARQARESGCPIVIGVAGALGDGYRELYDLFDLLVGLPREPMSLEESMSGAGTLLETWGEDLVRILRLSED